MKSKLILGLGIFGLSVGMLGMGISTSAHSIEEEHTHESTQLFENDILANLQESHEEEVNPNARMGYRWRCKTCGYNSEWHMLSNTASKYAVAHHMKYGHSVVVFGV
ncbi:MAG: hypothetical protein H9W82_00260 [Lactobacillus sp.]|nr:hypothetical protein [Lactobacillus sp.]